MITELSEKLDNELRELKMSCELLKEQNGDLQRKISFFIKVGMSVCLVARYMYIVTRRVL